MVVPYVKNILVILFFNLIFQLGWAQATIFSEVTVNKSNVYVGEAVELTIGVYTSTWFTKGVDIGNIKVNGAFSVYFRSVSVTKKIRGKNYAGVQFIYNIFPFENQDIIIPSLNVEVETPKEGDYKGVKRQLKTQEKTLKIKPFPPGIDKSTWMVTNGMTVNEQWIGNTKEVKVGDVIERKITRRASNTVSELIPPILWDSIPSVSLYPSQPSINTNKSKTAISATRTDGVRYLFEEEGTINIPEMEFVWWSPYSKKFLKKTIKGLTINVLANPDLEILKTAKKELTANAFQEEDLKPSKAKTLIFGLSIKEFLILLVLIAITLFILIKMTLKTIRIITHNKEAYKKSEAYAFKQVIKSFDSHDKKLIIPVLYKWLDHYNLEEPTLKALALKSGNNELINEVEEIERQMKLGDSKLLINKELWRKGRKEILKVKKKSVLVNNWINP